MPLQVTNKFSALGYLYSSSKARIIKAQEAVGVAYPWTFLKPLLDGSILVDLMTAFEWMKKFGSFKHRSSILKDAPCIPMVSCTFTKYSL